MKSPKRINILGNGTAHGTSAPTFHLSDTLNWSCFSARIKNQVVLVPTYAEIYCDTQIPKDSNSKNTGIKFDDQQSEANYEI